MAAGAHAATPWTARPSAVIEQAAWAIPLPTRRLLSLLAVVVAGVLAGSGLIAAWVADRNAATIEEATTTGLGIARATTEFRTNLAAADAEAAATLISGGLEDPERRARYDADLLAAGRALTDAGLVATDDDAADISALADGLVRYAGLVETSRANSRQGFPVGSAYLNQARSIARDELVPLAERLRRVGEQRVAEAANRVGGPVRAVAIGGLGLATLVLVGASAIVAGRSRRIAHPALIGSLAVVLVALGLVTGGVVTQSSELRTAATTDFDAYVQANQAAFTVSNLRVTEIAAVAARGSGAPLHAQFATDAAALIEALRAAGDEPALRSAVNEYVAGVDEVTAADLGGDNREAARLTLEGASAAGFAEADAAATDAVDRTAFDLADRFSAAAAADVIPLVPLVLGLVAAALAAVGIFARARRYR